MIRWSQYPAMRAGARERSSELRSDVGREQYAVDPAADGGWRLWINGTHAETHETRRAAKERAEQYAAHAFSYVQGTASPGGHWRHFANGTSSWIPPL